MNFVSVLEMARERRSATAWRHVAEEQSRRAELAEAKLRAIREHMPEYWTMVLTPVLERIQ